MTPSTDSFIFIDSVFRVDNLTGQRWMKVQTWGKYRFINFDEWIENQQDTSWDLVMKIVKNY